MILFPLLFITLVKHIYDDNVNDGDDEDDEEEATPYFVNPYKYFNHFILFAFFLFVSSLYFII